MGTLPTGWFQRDHTVVLEAGAESQREPAAVPPPAFTQGNDLASPRVLWWGWKQNHFGTQTIGRIFIYALKWIWESPHRQSPLMPVQVNDSSRNLCYCTSIQESNLPSCTWIGVDSNWSESRPLRCKPKSKSRVHMSRQEAKVCQWA